MMLIDKGEAIGEATSNWMPEAERIAAIDSHWLWFFSSKFWSMRSSVILLLQHDQLCQEKSIVEI